MNLTVNLTGLKTLQEKLGAIAPRKMASALSMAINKTAAKGVAEINRAIPERYAISRAEVANAISINTASAAKPQATITLFNSTRRLGRSLNMIHFVEKKVTLAEGRKRKRAGTQNQLRYQIIRGNGKKTIAGSFIGNQGRTVFRRTGKSRLPIKPVQVIGVAGMFNFTPLRERVLNKINADFAVELNRAIEQKLRSA